MGFTLQVEGIAELDQGLEELKGKASGIAAQGLYEGAGVVADKVSSAIGGIATEPFKYATNGQTRKPSPEEKAILTNARHGVARFKNAGVSINTSVGFQNSGYGAITWNHAKSSTRTKYKVDKSGKARTAGRDRSGTSSKPVAMIASAINSGTSFMQKQPFLRKAFSQSNGAAKAAIENKIKEQIDEINLD